MFKQFTPTRRAIALTSEDIRSTLRGTNRRMPRQEPPWKRISEALKDTVSSVVKSLSSSRLELVPHGSHQATPVTKRPRLNRRKLRSFSCRRIRHARPCCGCLWMAWPKRRTNCCRRELRRRRSDVGAHTSNVWYQRLMLVSTGS